MSKYDYDAVIIGAGVSGLVCGCYLAKAGLKTLIVEKNAKPGGYCTSFGRRGFHFDACVHSLGSCREGGNIKRVLKELELEEKLKIIRYDPSDVIITPDYKISFWSNLDKTIQEFQKHFLKEAGNIKRFFDDLSTSNGASLLPLRNKTFNDLLDEYFNNKQLKAILSFPVLGNTGLPASLISAFSAHKLYSEFMLDGGYCLIGGMRALPDALAARFQELGGSLLLKNVVKKIRIKNNAPEGIILGKNNFISAKYVVSSIDARQTFLELIEEKLAEDFLLNTLAKMEPSLSMFILYLGLEKEIRSLPNEGSNTWYLPYYDIENMYLEANKRKPDNLAEYMIHVFSENSMAVFINAQFEDKKYWDTCKELLSEELIRRAEKVVPDLSRYVVYKQMATPYVLYKTTLNYKGAAYGWAGIPSQFAVHGLSQITPIENLYLTGHWATLAQGVGGVAYLARDTAKMIVGKN